MEERGRAGGGTEEDGCLFFLLQGVRGWERRKEQKQGGGSEADEGVRRWD